MTTKTTRTTGRALALALALALGLAGTGAAQATTTVTTSTYDKASTSADITKSCKELVIALDVLKGKCNVADSDGEVTASEDDVDIEKYVYCTRDDGSDYWYITYGKAPVGPGARAKKWRVDVNSVAKRYEVWVTCTENDGTEHTESWLNLGDVDDGFKNSSGDFTSRMGY